MTDEKQPDFKWVKFTVHCLHLITAPIPVNEEQLEFEKSKEAKKLL